MRRIIGNSAQEAITRRTQKPTDFTSRMTMVNRKSFSRVVPTDGTNAILRLQQFLILLKCNAKFAFEGISSCVSLKFRRVLNAVVVGFVSGFHDVQIPPVIRSLLSQNLLSSLTIITMVLRDSALSITLAIPTFISRSTIFAQRLAKLLILDLPTKGFYRLVGLALSANHESIIAYSVPSNQI